MNQPRKKLNPPPERGGPVPPIEVVELTGTHDWGPNPPKGGALIPAGPPPDVVEAAAGERTREAVPRPANGAPAPDTTPAAGRTGAAAQGVAEAVERRSLAEEVRHEAERFRWVESQKAGRDLGEEAIRRWVHEHWANYIRTRWVEHLEGRTYWAELDQVDFGLLPRLAPGRAEVVSRIADRLKHGEENLAIIEWAAGERLPMDTVFQVLTALDVNGRRLRAFGRCHPHTN